MQVARLRLSVTPEEKRWRMACQCSAESDKMGISCPNHWSVRLLRLGIVLIDGEQLSALMIRHNVGARIDETLYPKKVDKALFWMSSRQ